MHSCEFRAPSSAIYLTGPTASGKTAISLVLARTLDAEIVSLDSMAVYRGMDIGTAKPTVAERAVVPHHLIDVLDPHESFSLAEYLKLAEAASAEIESRGKRVMFVGGTPLYLKALLRGVFEGPPADWELRERWQGFGTENGPGSLHAALAQVDPLSAERLKPADERRIIRAIEVFEITGESITRLQQQFDRARPASDCHVYVLDWPRDVLYQRINQRVEQMFAAGWIDETEQLLSMDPPPSRTALQAVGYREIGEHLTGQRDLAGTIELVQTRTRQFSKRQRTWFRGLSECTWIGMDNPDPAAVAAKIASLATR